MRVLRVFRSVRGELDGCDSRHGEDELEHVSWDDWFEKFEEQELAFLYQVHKADSEDSTFFKLVRR